MTNTCRILVLIATCGLFVFLSETVFSPSANEHYFMSSSNWRLRKGNMTTTTMTTSSSDSDSVGIDDVSSTKKMQQPQQVHDNMNATSSMQAIVHNSTKKEAAADGDSHPEQPPPLQTTTSNSSSSSLKNETVQAATTAAATTTTTSSSSSSWLLPLYIGAGQGTTGTRTLYDSMCSLGIPSVHFEQYCIHPTMTTTNNKNSKGGDNISKAATAAATAAETATIKSLEQGVQYHQQVLVYWRLLRNCADDYRKHNGSSCSIESFDEYATNLRLYVAKVINSGIGSVHDVPYAHMVPFIINIANNNNININNDSSSANVGQGSSSGGGRGRGRGSIVLLTERDPDEWVASRINHHANSADLICHDLSIDAFDLEECIVKHHDHVENLFLDYQYIHRDLDKDQEDEFVLLSSKAMDRYQTKIITQYEPAVVVNFWKQAYNTSSLADFVWSSTQPLLLPSSSSTTTTNNNNAVVAMIKDIKEVASNGGLKFQRSPAIEKLLQDEQDRQDQEDEDSA